MKKILLTFFLFLGFCIPSFAGQTISLHDINIDVAKKAISVYMMNKGWVLKNETNYSIVFEIEERAHDPELYEREKLEREQLYQLYQSKLRIADQMQDGIDKTMLLRSANSIKDRVARTQPEYYNSWTTVNCQFVFTKKSDSVIIDSNYTDIRNMQKIVFNGYYDYKITYKIPLLKKHVEIIDTPQTRYSDMNRIGGKAKITKINDKSVKDYTKQEIQNFFNNCSFEKVKLESDKGKTYYILRTFIEPTYKKNI